MKKFLFSIMFCLTLVLSLFATACGKLKYNVEFYVDGELYATVGTDGEEIGMPADPEKEGEFFDGWYLDEGVWKKSFTAQSLLDQPLSEEVNLKVYAKWKSDEKNNDDSLVIGLRDFTYDGDERAYRLSVSNGTTEIDFNEYVIEDDELVWAVSADKDFSEIQKTTKFSLNEGDNVVYLRVQDGETKNVMKTVIRRRPIYTVTFDTDGGSEIAAQRVEEGATIQTENLQTAKDGYDFSAWNKDVSAPITENTVFKALWTGKTYVVYFDTNGGSLSTDRQEVTYGQKVSLPTPQKDGYDFVGWFDGETVLKDGIYSRIGDTNVTARWTLATYSISYVLNGGKNVSSNSTSYTMQSETVTLADPTRMGATFAGWYTESNFKTEVTEIASGSFGNVVLYAKWDLITYTVTYHLDGGTALEEAMTTYNVETPYVWFSEARKDDHTFCGWYTNAECSGQSVQYLAQGNVGDVEVWAKWQYGTQGLYYEENADGDYVVTGYGGSSTRVVIPGTFDGKAVVEIEESSFYYSETVKELILCEGIKKVGDRAFESTQALEYVSIPSTVEELGKDAFANGKALTNVYYNAKNCKAFYTDEEAFLHDDRKWGREAVAFHITVGKDVESLPDRFTYGACPSSVTFEEGSVLKTIGARAFSGIRNTGSLVLPDTVKTIGDYALSSAFTEIILPSGLEVLGGYVFANCGNLQEIVIPETVGAVGTTLFENVPEVLVKLEAKEINEYWNSKWNSTGNIVILDCKNNNVATDGNEYVVLDKSLYSVINGEATYVRPTSTATEIVVPESISYGGNTYDVATIAENAFRGRKITLITLPDSLTELPAYCFYNCTSLTTAVLGKGVTTLGNNAFSGCTALVSVENTENITTLGSSVFYGCKNLQSISFPKVDVVSDSAFMNCIALTDITLSPTLKTIGSDAFWGCGITEMEFPETLTKIGDYAFRDSKLTSALLPDSVQEVGSSVFYCAPVKEARIPNGWTTIPSSMFDRTGISEIEIPESVTEIGFCAFYSCHNLKKVTIKGNNLVKIDAYAFYNCGFTEIYLPETLQSIGHSAFSYTPIESINVPKSVTYIDNYAFLSCSQLKSVLLPAALTTLGDDVFKGTHEHLTVYTEKANFSISAAPVNITGCTLSEDGSYVVSVTKNVWWDCYSSSMVIDPVRKGYTFLGWYTNPNLESSKVTNLADVANETVLYAKWQAVEEV